MRVALFAACFLSSITYRAFAAGTQSDYERAYRLESMTRNCVTHAVVEPHWLADDVMWFRSDLGLGRSEYVLVDPKSATRRVAFDHAALAAAVRKATGQTVDAQRLRLEITAVSADGVEVGFLGFHDAWIWDGKSLRQRGTATAPSTRAGAAARSSSDAVADGAPVGAPGPRPESPDGRWIVLEKAGNLAMRNTRTGEESALTRNGSADDHYDAGNVWWSPDSAHLVAMKTSDAQEHRVYMVDSSPRDQVQPKLKVIDYLKPGDRIAVSKPHLFAVDGMKEIAVADALFPTPWSIEEMRWDPDSKRFTFLYNQRGHQVLRLVAVDGFTGAARALIDETSKTFIDYADKTFLRYLPETREAIWMSERDGWNHLYLIDTQKGAVKNQITRGEWVVTEVERVDVVKRQIWFRALGIYPGQDPYYVHECRIDFDGSHLVKLTAGDGTHRTVLSPDGRYLLDTYSRVDMPPVTELRRAEDGSPVCEVERADWSKLLATGWAVPERFVAKGRDGATDIYGVIYRPRQMEEGRRYPVIEDIYAGPQGFFVPKAFSRFDEKQRLAELGFVVVQIDGMGTNGRSRAFHDVCWHNLGDAGFPDRILWMKAAAAKYPEMDLSRVGIYGVSAGAQSALRALEAFGDFYKVAVSDCGCHDNRMDKIWWNELWMGWPVGPWYREQSNVINAHNMNGKLLLMVGELDTNVDPASTMQVVNALILADKDFDLLVIPGKDHGAGEGPYGTRRRYDFFVRNLLGVEPPPR